MDNLVEVIVDVGVPRLRRSCFELIRVPALTGWANFCRASGAGARKH